MDSKHLPYALVPYASFSQPRKNTGKLPNMHVAAESMKCEAQEDPPTGSKEYRTFLRRPTPADKRTHTGNYHSSQKQSFSSAANSFSSTRARLCALISFTVFHTSPDSLPLCAKIFVFSLIHQMYAEIQKQKNVPLAGIADGGSDVNILYVLGPEVPPLSCLPTGPAGRKFARQTTAGTSITHSTCQGRAPAATRAPPNP